MQLFNMSNYKGGVITSSDCQGTEINHAVLLVGFGEGTD